MASWQLAPIGNVVAAICGLATTRAGVCSNWCQPSGTCFVTDPLGGLISATQLRNGRRERNELFRQAGSLPY
jgi:hypothetical protein